MSIQQWGWALRRFGYALCVCLLAGQVAAEDDFAVEQWLAELAERPYLEEVEASKKVVRNHLIPLGAAQKASGVWQFKDEARESGELARRTWQVLDGYTSIEVFEDLVAQLGARTDVSLLFVCEGRACGHGAQWANRAFGQRVLYGRDDNQRYHAYTLGEANQYRILLYASARTAQRQYLQTDVLRLETENSAGEASTAVRDANK